MEADLNLYIVRSALLAIAFFELMWYLMVSFESKLTPSTVFVCEMGMCVGLFVYGFSCMFLGCVDPRLKYVIFYFSVFVFIRHFSSHSVTCVISVCILVVSLSMFVDLTSCVTSSAYCSVSESVWMGSGRSFVYMLYKVGLRTEP